MGTFVQLLVNGLGKGAVYALLALGFVIIFKATEVVNFAHGSLVLVGGYLLYVLKDTVGSLARQGVQFTTDLPATAPALLVALQGEDGDESWVGFQNFYAITRYNHSAMYALAVFQLGEAIAAGTRPSLADVDTQTPAADGGMRTEGPAGE